MPEFNGVVLEVDVYGMVVTACLDAYCIFPVALRVIAQASYDCDVAGALVDFFVFDELELARGQAVVIDADQRGAQRSIQVFFDLLISGIQQQRIVPELKNLESDG
ncbi:hypothetical protein D3C80_1883940 [compost metagenome]